MVTTIFRKRFADQLVGANGVSKRPNDVSLWLWAIFLLVLVSGCVENGMSNIMPSNKRSFHQKFNWKAENFFDDSMVISLCKAIEANDFKAIDRLIAEGANVNAKGEGNMTPLLWAFPDDKIDRFKLLLKHGADPNVLITTNLGIPNAFEPGVSVTILAAKTYFPDYFSAVMEYGGDPNLRGPMGGTSLHAIIKSPAANRLERIELALKHGADINAVDLTHTTPVMMAVGWAGQYEVALRLLESGADFEIYYYDELQKLIHFVVKEENLPRSRSAERTTSFDRLATWLAEHGQNADEARSDLERWASFPHYDPKKFKTMMDRERRERKRVTKIPSNRIESHP